MSLTTWDGHARVDYVAPQQLLLVTLATIESTVEADVRVGLRAAFVVDGPDGPPAFVRAVLRFGSLPADLRGLLGERLAEAADEVVAGPERGRWVQLDLVELDDLATAWAPYRVVVRAAATEPAGRDVRAVVGAAAGRLWTWLAVDELRAALKTLAPLEPVFRGERNPAPAETEPDAGSGTWELPAVLAAAGGISPILRWTARRGGVTVLARAVGGSAEQVRLSVSFDDGADRWKPLVPAGPGELRATLASSQDRLPALKIRTDGGGEQ